MTSYTEIAMANVFDDILKQEDTFETLKKQGIEFHLFATSGEGIYVPGPKGLDRAEFVMNQVFDADQVVDASASPG